MTLAKQLQAHLEEAPEPTRVSESEAAAWLAKGHALVEASGCAVDAALYRTIVATVVVGTKRFEDGFEQVRTLLVRTRDHCRASETHAHEPAALGDPRRSKSARFPVSPIEPAWQTPVAFVAGLIVAAMFFLAFLKFAL